MTEPGLPMAGLRVLDISSFIAAPAAAVVLGDWGADVIKVEGPDGDPNRRIMHDSSNYPKGAVNYPWHMDSRNKRSIVLDLKKADARAALDRLIVLSDVLICNFPPLARDKLKLGYDEVKRVNPKRGTEVTQHFVKVSGEALAFFQAEKKTKEILEQ